ncbi:MAG TPA: flagellar motor protein MotB [Rhodocyclaceae bacterium]|nr:flagellar motor protein MotB [Rhodocyclaceae bacterium]
MSDDTKRPIVIKRVKKGGGGHHGGAWKIAYADFVTAMMAFFLLMWLLGSTAAGDLKGIADYFQSPLKMSMQGGPGAGAATSPINGGGKDLTKAVGEEARSDYKDPKKSTKVHVTAPTQQEAGPSIGHEAGERGSSVEITDSEKQEAIRQQEQVERATLQEAKSKIEAVLEASPELRQFKNQIMIDLTSEGLRIQIVDGQNRPMFDNASAELKPYTRTMLHAIGQVLNRVDNYISISGHTDASNYAGGASGFSNWELSANRANACRRELIAGGMDDKKIVRVVGMSSMIPLDKNDPFNPINRRISIVVMNKKTSDAMLQQEQDAEELSNQPMDTAPLVARPPTSLVPPIPKIELPIKLRRAQ